MTVVQAVALFIMVMIPAVLADSPNVNEQGMTMLAVFMAALIGFLEIVKYNS